jgi:uncharacterized protein YggT (Ycf19 family)
MEQAVVGPADNILHLLRYAHFYLPLFYLAAVAWTMIGRFVLGLFVPPDWDNYIWRCFRWLTDPWLRWVSYITPRFMLDSLMPLVAAFWLFVLRIIFGIVMINLGLAPSVSPP